MQSTTIKTRLLAVLLTLCMVLPSVPLSVFALNSTVGNEAELEAALEDADCAEIKLGGNVEITWGLDIERSVTLNLNGYTLSCSAADEDILQIRSSGSLTVKDSGTGGKIDGQNKNCGIEVRGGSLTLDSGSIVNCTDADGDGGAVDVSKTSVTETTIQYGTFVMNGGTIMDCKAGDDGGAVDIGSGCTFVMNGGLIENCRADDDGGAVYIKQRGSFALNGGIIRNCSAGANGGAVNIYRNGRFTMTGGTIKSCKVDLGGLGMAVYGSNEDAVVVMTGGSFEDCGAFPYSFDEFTVTFDSDGGSAVSEQKLRNAPAVKPADPQKSGYDFAGWYLGDTQYPFDTNVTENLTLRAHWTPSTTSTTIAAAAIENVKFHYQPGEAPQATAWVFVVDTEKYEIAYECWQQFENNEPVAAWYSDHANHGSLPTITAFESGKRYVYSLMLRPKDGYAFSKETAITVNGEKVTAPFVGGAMYIPAVKTMTIPTVTTIDVVEINGVTLSFQDGDKPVFTGKVPENVNYAYRAEWWELDSKTGLISTEPEWGSGIYENKITAFEAGKTYHYGVYLTAVGYVESENTTYIFTPNTKLKINGEFVNYSRYEGDESDGSDGTMWVITDLTMTPQPSAPHSHSYGTAWKYDETNHWHECACGDTADSAAHTFHWVIDKEATATEKGSKHEECTVCGYQKTAVSIPATGAYEPCDGVNCPGKAFADMPAKGNWAHDPIDWAVSNEITNGTSKTTFAPGAACTRAQVVTFLWRAAGQPAPTSSTALFTDVKEDRYYYNAVLWAKENGITGGTGNGKFSPDMICSRAQIVTFLWRYEGQPAPTSTSNPFADVNPSAYFGSAVLWAVENNITNGTGKNTFAPDTDCSRAQVVTFLYRDALKESLQ